MTAILLLALFSLAFVAAMLACGGSPRRFAVLLMVFAFMACIIYWTLLAGVVFAH
jgi:hypothetical protein